MSDVSKLYLKSIYSRFGYFGTWLPNSPMSLGEVGLQERGIFKRMTSLTDLGIPFEIRSSAHPVDFIYTSNSGLSTQLKLAGEIAGGSTLPVAQGGVVIEFTQEGAFLFQAVDCLSDEIANRSVVGKLVLQAFRDGHWQSDWCVVDSVVNADCSTILVANSKRAKLELSSKGPLDITNMANVDANLAVHSQQGDVLRILAADGLAPLFRLSSIKHSLVARIFGGSGIRFGGSPPITPPEHVSDEECLEAVQPIFE